MQTHGSIARAPYSLGTYLIASRPFYTKGGAFRRFTAQHYQKSFNYHKSPSNPPGVKTLELPLLVRSSISLFYLSRRAVFFCFFHHFFGRGNFGLPSTVYLFKFLSAQLFFRSVKHLATVTSMPKPKKKA